MYGCIYVVGFSNRMLVAGPFKGVWPALRAEAQPTEQRLLGTGAEEVRRGWEGDTDTRTRGLGDWRLEFPYIHGSSARSIICLNCNL